MAASPYWTAQPGARQIHRAICSSMAISLYAGALEMEIAGTTAASLLIRWAYRHGDHGGT
ncbi:MAG: hypothetical protein H6978_01750 [Gammaproteobacteria bacterium]|nr:hypothetical protein [Gammaproteobacteria bacterium]